MQQAAAEEGVDLAEGDIDVAAPDHPAALARPPIYHGGIPLPPIPMPGHVWRPLVGGDGRELPIGPAPVLHRQFPPRVAPPAGALAGPVHPPQGDCFFLHRPYRAEAQGLPALIPGGVGPGVRPINPRAARALAGPRACLQSLEYVQFTFQDLSSRQSDDRHSLRDLSSQELGFWYQETMRCPHER